MTGGELTVGHSYLTGAGDEPEEERVSVGLLGADFSLESLMRRFIKDPAIAYKPKKGPETDPRIMPVLNRGMRYVDEWAQPGGEKPAAEEESA